MSGIGFPTGIYLKEKEMIMIITTHFHFFIHGDIAFNALELFLKS